MPSEVHSKYKMLDQLLSYNDRFVIYKLPESKELILILQTEKHPQIYKDLLDFKDKQGFVISPFSVSKDNPIIIISPDIKLEGEDEIFKCLGSYLSNKEISSSSSLSVNKDKGLSTYSAYQSIFDVFHDKIEKGIANKLVLSFTKDLDRDSSLSIGIVFLKAIEKYTDNFVYLCNTPESGSWLGCSPEILLSGKGDQWKTHALAGTKKIVSGTSKISWDEKNIREQAIVFDYIQNNLRKIGIDATSNVAKTIQSGDLVHLQSEFTFKADNPNRISEILSLLHPTPAVCGYPREEALDIILKHEGYNRSYYSGFIGPYNIESNTNLYVNLRCMQVFEDSLRLYAGGGIMPQSTVDSEWQEIEYKMQTILSII